MKIVTIGGGTGTYQLLRGLRGMEVTAIVSMADNGGSSGRLRDEYGVLPPGDIRKSLIALSGSPELMRSIFAYRFDKGCLCGHNLGNLIITALIDITGSSGSAIKEAGSILNIQGRVLPVTLDDSQLMAELEDGQVITGETDIDVPKHDASLRIKRVYLSPDSEVYPDCIDTIRDADMIVIGPGDLYTSIIPNLLVRGVPEAILSSRAKIVYVCNIMTKHGETTGFKASDFVSEIERYLGRMPDHVVVNSAMPSPGLLASYGKEQSSLVVDDLGSDAVRADLLNESDILRHDPDKLKGVVLKLMDGSSSTCDDLSTTSL